MHFRRFATFVFILALTAACAPSASKPSADEIEKAEQAVYDYFVGGAEGKVVIMLETSAIFPQDTPDEVREYLKSELPEAPQEAVESYIERNTQPGKLSSDMQLDADFILVPAEEIYQITSQPDWDTLLTQTYEGAHGYTVFSRVGFNDTLDQAVVYVGNVAAPLMGAGYYYLMEKKNGQWIITEQVMVWIS